jgi:hypothetical protein
MLIRKSSFTMCCSLLAFGCTEPLIEQPAEQPTEQQEIVDNLVRAGFAADDIMVVGDTVYVGRDAKVSLLASREMLEEADDSTEEQYRTNNTVSPSIAKICINGATFTGVFGTALDLAIQNYDEQPLNFSMARTPSTGCSFTINAVILPGVVGGVSGFPSGGLPFGTINIGSGLASFSVDVIEHVITHEIGHTIGMRHSDFFNRSISCGGGGDNEGDGGVGAILIPGTPSGATPGGSLMNSCFSGSENGEFTSSDLTALRTLYGSAPLLGDFRAHVVDNRNFGGNIFSESFPYVIGSNCAPHFIRAGTPGAQWTSQAGGNCSFQGWLNPSNLHDCRASILAVTGGGFFGGTCLSWAYEVQNSADYSASNTVSAQVNTVNQTITVNAGQTLTVGTCGVPDSSFSGDTYLRLFDPLGGQVALNDDACGGLGSRLEFTATTSGTFSVHSGCYSSSNCSGTVAWTIQ